LRQFSAVRSKTLNFIIDKLLVTAAMIWCTHVHTYLYTLKIAYLS
jgi:hypothetical protein